jgi:DNA excision repair protein ERCC-5
VRREEEAQAERARAERARLDEETRALQKSQRKQSRDAEVVTDEMYDEAKRLLRLFGVPYVTAPFEAEAQCAQMELAGLVDGVVTEDNDAFLFGARRVYKNLFDPNRHVEVYAMDDVEAEFGLGRERLISLAQLLGSDYTDGVHGVGIVNAMETLSAFGHEQADLAQFGRWVSAWRGATAEGEPEGGKAGVAEEVVDEPADESAARRAAQLRFEERHAKLRRNWVLPDGFPSSAVRDAYLRPQVDGDEEPCSWAAPDLIGLREFCDAKFGWTASRADEQLLPMMAEYEKGSAQRRIDSCFSFERRAAKIKSSRVAAAVGADRLAAAGAVTAMAAAQASGAMPAPRKRKAAAASPAALRKQPAKKKKEKQKQKAAGEAAPKRGCSAYMLWQNAHREQAKAENPAATFGELGKILGAKWREMDAADKTEWEAKARADKARYEREMVAFRQAQRAAPGDSADDLDFDDFE